jgi:hypothetical protein
MNCYAKLRNKIQDIRLNLPGTVRSNPAQDDQGKGTQQKHYLRESSTSGDLGKRHK